MLDEPELPEHEVQEPEDVPSTWRPFLPSPTQRSLQ